MSPIDGTSAGSPATSHALFAGADSFARSVADRIPEWERRRSVDPSTFTLAARSGLTAIEVPEEHGGLGLDFRHKVRVAEILSRTSMALAFSLTNTQNVAARIAAGGSETHRRQLLPDLVAGRRTGSTALTEPGAGSDFGAITTEARRSDGRWILHGDKAWITNAATSDVIICYAQTEPGSGSKGIASFLVDGTRDGFVRHRPYDLSGGHIIGTGGFTLDGYRADDEDLLTEPGAGFVAALSGVNGARIYVAAMCNAMVHSALEVAVGYGHDRTAFDKKLLEHQGLAWSLAAVANRLEASQLLTERAIDSLESDEVGEVILAAAHAKKFATEMAEPAIAACIQAMGAEGLRDRYPLGRHLAEARIANFVDGSTEMQTERIARTLRSVYRRPVYDHTDTDSAVEQDSPPSIAAEPHQPEQAPVPDAPGTRAPGTEPIRAAPPLPGDDHRTAAGAPVPPPADSLPPLPPDSLRTDDG